MTTELDPVEEQTLDSILKAGITEEDFNSLDVLEKKILAYMASRPGFALSSHEILSFASSRFADYTPREARSVLIEIMKKLRKKIKNDNDEPNPITSLTRFGYRFDSPSYLGERTTYYFNGILMNVDSMQVFVNGEDVGLTIAEYRILKVLMGNRNIRLTAPQIIGAMNADPDFPDNYYSLGALKVQLKNARKKIKKINDDTDIIDNIRGLGYLIEDPNFDDNPRTKEYGNLYLNLDRKQAFVNGEDVGLTAFEYMILKILMLNPSTTLSDRQIRDAMKSDPDSHGYFEQSGKIKTHISRIRDKIGQYDDGSLRIETVQGKGYKFYIPETIAA